MVMKRWRRRPTAVLAACLVASSAAVAGLPGPAGAAPATVTIAGSLQSELGCPGDWQPECGATHLAYDANDDVWQATFAVPAGAHEYKAALDGTWAENYGRGAVRDGANIPLAVDPAGPVKFFYDHETHWVTDNVNSVIATAPGSFQSELGCSADWDPGCLRSWLQDPDEDGIGRLTVTNLPPGDYAFKVAIDESWDENYGAGGVRGGPDIPFKVGDRADVVRFSYDQVSHVAEVSVVPTEPVDDAALVREPVRHPFVDEVLYFTIPDRFDDGNPANNCGDYAGTCRAGGTQEEVLAHGYLPNQKGYYHGGDLEGLRRQLPYLERLGITAIWVGPIYANQTVQSDTTDLYGHSAGYHGYWILDFLRVDPHLGSNEEFARLVDEAHDRDIDVFMDIVTNHTADVIQLEGNAGYRNTRDFPYTTPVAGGRQPFDDRDYAYEGQDPYTFPTVDLQSFPYTPVVPPSPSKNPDWLDDPRLYHNRGNTSFTGENSLYGDFFGLDDLWTERKEVVDGMVDIYSFWIEEFGVDGFRIDTTKHVNMEFWKVFGPDILEAAEARGIDDFFAFGEVFDQQFGSPFMSEFSTEGRLQSTIDFAFQVAARDFASESLATNGLRSFFERDDYYTDADSNAYAQPTFLGNHDMGRIGHFLQRVDQVGATDAELLARSQLAHALMFFARGQPVVYYGDEQGFTGDGGDKDAREDMFANTVPVYADNDLIGTNETTSDDNFDPSHPLYKTIRELARLDRHNPALQGGAQIHRYSTAAPGVYAFSRIDRGERIEYVVALNNSEAAASAVVPTFSNPEARYDLVARHPAAGSSRSIFTDANGDLSVVVPPLGYIVYRARRPVPSSEAAPGISITSLQDGATVPIGENLWDGQPIDDRIEVGAELNRDVMAEVTFAVREGAGEWTTIGTDDNAPYRVFYDVSHLRGQPPTKLAFRAIVNDLNGHLAADQVSEIGVEFVEATGPANPYAIIHYNRPASDYGDHTTGNANDSWGLHLWGDAIDPAEATDWTTPKPFLGEDEYGRFAFVRLADDTRPVNFIVHRGDTKDPDNSPDRSFPASPSPEIWLRQGDPTIYTSQAEAQGYATVHYECAAAGCPGVTIDATSEGVPVETGSPPDAVDDYGAVFVLSPASLAAPLTATISDGGTVDIDAVAFTPTEIPTAWFQAGDQVVYRSRGAAEDFATVHYRRPAGDYGDPTSGNFMDFWGLHVWTGAVAEPLPWDQPLRPVGQDVFGIEFRVPLVDGAQQLAYILHRGDTKDPGPDQFLVFATYGHEVWQLQAADPERPYVAPLARGP
jgi:glycosidase